MNKNLVEVVTRPSICLLARILCCEVTFKKYVLTRLCQDVVTSIDIDVTQASRPGESWSGLVSLVDSKRGSIYSQFIF